MEKRIINIQFQNREHQNLWFEELTENTWELKTDSNYAMKYASVNYEPVNSDTEADFVMTDQYGVERMGKIISFDPSGGPYMSVGNYKIDDKKVVRIHETEDKKIIFTTEV